MKLGGIYEPEYPLQLLYAISPNLFLNWDTVPMTAIAVVSLVDGFVIGADGLRQTTDGSILTKNGQKVFGFQNKKTTLAYAWCGQTVVWNEDDHDQVFFDFRLATEPALILASLASFSYGSFAENFRIALSTSLVCSNYASANWIKDFPNKSMARMLMVGYFDGDLFLTEIKVERENNAPVLSVRSFVPSNDLRVFSGCRSVGQDGGLERQPKTIEDARVLIHEYIERCANDPQCKGIGGRTHVALVKPGSFTWIDPPIPEN